MRDMANQKLIAARKEKGWSIAIASARVGVSRVTYSRWENGHQEPQPTVLEMLCNAFGRSADDLGYGHLSRIPDLIRTSTNILTLQPNELLSPAGESIPDDSATWFSEKLVQVMHMIHQWRGRAELCIDIQKMLDMEFTMFDEIQPFYSTEDYHLSRRQALLAIAAFPMSLLTGLQQGNKAERMVEELLPLCSASVTACWHLMKGKEIISVERALSRYFPLLVSWARQPSNHQRLAAYLAAQGCMLMGLVELHQTHMRQWLAYCTQAVEHAKAAQDTTLHVYTLIFLGAALKDNGQTRAMLQTYQEAARHLKEIDPLVQSKVLAELARSYARNGDAQESLRSISQARDIFPGDVKDVPCFVSADCGLFQLILLEGATHLELGAYNSATNHFQHAWESLAQIEQMPADTIPDRIRFEVLNQRALTSVKVGNLEKFQEFLIEGVNGAKVLRSGKRYQELISVYKEARVKWPHEPQVKELADLLV